jgi:hypothetical protein
MNHHLRFLPGLIVCGLVACAYSAHAEKGSARIDAVRGGKVSVSEDGVSWKEAKQGAVLFQGATLKTDSMGVVDLYLGKNGPYVRLTPDTTLSLNNLSHESGAGETIVTTEMGLKAGKIQGVVRKMSAASKYEVMTPVGVVGIRGTKYQISARGEASVAEGEGYVKYNAPGSAAPTDFSLRTGYTFEPTLNNNKGGLIETLPSVNEEIMLAVGEFGGGVPGELVEATWRPVPTWATIPRQFQPPGQGNTFQPWVLKPTVNPTTPVVSPTVPDNGGGEGE